VSAATEAEESIARDGLGALAMRRRLTAEKVELDLERYPKARCLDGTPGAYYVNMANPMVSSASMAGSDGWMSAFGGSGSGSSDGYALGSSDGYATSRTWVVMLQGGGECVNAPECAERAGTARGSSELLPDEIIFDRGIQQVSRDEDGQEVPFSAANMVTIAYCSGDVYVGRATEPDAGGMWHSGAHIVEAVLRELIRAYGMQNADVIVLAGRSAGAIGLIAQVDAWADFIRKKLGEVASSSLKIVGAPFAGFHYFHDNSTLYDAEHSVDEDELTYMPWNEQSFKGYVDYWRGTESMPAACVDEHENAPWQCVVANTSFPYTRTPLFFTQALTDSVVMHLHDNFQVSGGSFRNEQAEFAHEWSENMRSALEMVKAHPTAGLFAASCYVHTDFDGIVIDGVSHHTALANWVFKDSSVKLMDSCDDFMCNPTCKKRDSALDADDAMSARSSENDVQVDEDEASLSRQEGDRTEAQPPNSPTKPSSSAPKPETDESAKSASAVAADAADADDAAQPPAQRRAARARDAARRREHLAEPS